MARKGQSAERLRALRKKYGLGEFRVDGTGKRKRTAPAQKRRRRPSSSPPRGEQSGDLFSV